MISLTFSIGQALDKGVVNPLGGNESHAAVAFIRIVFSAIIILLAFFGGLVSVKTKQNRYLDISVISIMMSNVVMAIVVGAGYSHELINRFFIYLLPGLVYFAVKLFDFRFSIIPLVVVLIVCLPLSFISQYGNQAMDYVTPANLSGYNLFHKNTLDGAISGAIPLGNIKNSEAYIILPYDTLEIIDGKVDIKTSLWQRDHYIYFPHYINIDNHNFSEMEFYYNQPAYLTNLQENLELTPYCNLLFSNPDMNLYEKESVLPSR
jgi:hypothetical protein